MTKDRKAKKIYILLTAVSLISAASLTLHAAESGAETIEMTASPVEIYTCEDLLQIAENPDGNYRLMDNINMEGLAWNPVDFSGIFDGNGYALLNLKIESTGTGTEQTYDGNYKVYDTYFAGFFGSLKNATVHDLNLVNVQVRIEADLPCFVGSIAGYSENSTVQGCSVQGRLELAAHDRMFGVGGIIGYGSGSIQQTSADMTLICTDTDAATRDEQFMGGAYSAGYIDLNECDITIDGYISEHGYVHSGGLVGMYILYPRGFTYEGFITGNAVTGKITFFEDNTNRRAYCKELIGEVMNWTYQNGRNSASFERNEIFDYSADLRPDMCVDAVHTESVTPPGCDTFGYTTVKCEGCGYTYTDHYTLYQHSVAEWKVTQEPTTLSPGIQTGICTLCGTVLTAETEKLAPTPEPAPDTETSPDTSSLEASPSPHNSADHSDTVERDVMDIFKNPAVIGVIVALVLLLAAGEIAIFKNNKR